MTHLNIQQGLNVEVVSASIIKKLYEAALSVPEPLEGELDAAYMSGNLLVDKTYRAQVLYLTTRFPNLHINVTDSYYVPFEDPNVLSVLMANNISSDGIGITETDADEAQANKFTNLFKENTTITKFNEFKYFTKANQGSHYGLFCDATNLEEIDLSEATFIGGWLFRATSLKTLNAPNLQNINALEAFARCPKLTSVLNLGLISLLPKMTFYNCSVLSNVVLPESCITILESCFGWTDSLSDINLQNVESFGPTAFYSSSLSNVSADSMLNTKTIGNLAFYNTKLFGVLNLPKLTSLGNQAFNRCSLITGIECLGKISTISNSSVFYGTSITYAKLPYECTTIGNSTFQDCSSLTSVKQYTDSIDNWVEGEEPTTGPLSRVTSFETNCFYNCSLLLLTQLDIQNATTIGKNAFNGTLLSGQIDLSNASSIGEGAFANTKITSVNLGSNITSLPTSCFSGCTNLTHIYGLENVTYISTYFANASALFSNMDVLHFDNATSCESAITNHDMLQTYPCHMYFPKLTTMSGSYCDNRTYHNGFFTERGEFGCSFVYFRDISVVKPGTFCYANIKSFVINNITPPSVTGIEAGNYRKSLDRIFYDSEIENIYVPDASISAYQNSDFLSSYLLNGYTKNNVQMYPQLRGMSELTHYATEADWVTAGKPADGIIDAYM